MVGPDMLNTRTEKDLKAQIREIREIAVLSVDPVQFSGPKQDQGESSQKYKCQYADNHFSYKLKMGSVILQSPVQTATVSSTDGHSLQYRRPQSPVQY